MKNIKDKDYEKEIIEKCSILYCMHDKPMTQTCMCWGFECNSGWFSIIDEMSSKLEALNLIYYPKYKVRIQADQLKEKFGHLTFYFSVICEDVERTKEQEVIVTAMNSWADEIVRWAEDECYKTCEECGNQIGTTWSPRCETSGWITYICDRCASKTKGFYFKNGAKWQEGKLLMTKEEVEAERKRIDKEIEEKYKKEKENEDKK